MSCIHERSISDLLRLNQRANSMSDDAMHFLKGIAN